MTIKFEVGVEYGTRSICDHECIFRFTVVDRTEKTIVIDGMDGRKRRKVRVRDGAEECDPLGRFSMAPVLSATDTM